MQKISLYLMVILLFAASFGCSTLNEIFNPSPEPDVEAEFVGNLEGLGEKMIDTLEAEDAVPPGHLLGKVEFKITKSDKEYLDEKCSGCHEMDRILMSHRAPRLVWEKMLDEPQHMEMKLTLEEKERVYKIFEHEAD